MAKPKPEPSIGFPFEQERSEYAKKDKLTTAKAEGKATRTRHKRIDVWTPLAFSRRLEHFIGAKERGPLLSDEEGALLVLETDTGRAVFWQPSTAGNYPMTFYFA